MTVAVAAPVEGAGFGVLLVEDNPVDELVARRVLRLSEPATGEICSVSSLSEARSRYDARRHDVVLLDLSLPDARGLDAVRGILALDPDAAIVVLTGSDDDRLGDEAVRLGAQDYLTKSSLTSPALRRVVRYARNRRAARREAEARVRQIETQLVHGQKLECVGRLAGGIAHDFNNVLAAVMAFSELLLMDSPPDDPRRPDVETILDAATRASGLTRQLLAFSSRQVFAPRPTDLNALIGGLDRMLRRLIGEDVELVTLFGEQLAQVEIDPGQIESVIVNLVVNAREAMPYGGALTIETANVDLPAGEEGALPGPAVRITVTDNGIGMSEDVRCRVFEPFFTTRPGVGSGLGLASAYGIVKQSGGRIAVRSAPGTGACFTIDLPAPRGTPPVAAPRPAKAQSGGCETVLVAEDNAMVLRGVTAMLQARGYTVIPTRNGQEALEVARRLETRVDLLLSDMVMPLVSGPALGEAVRTLRPGVPLLFMSGYLDDQVPSSLPSAAFVQKPFTSDELALRVRSALDGARKMT